MTTKKYPFNMGRHQHDLYTYQTAIHNRLWDACEDGNTDAMEHYGKLAEEADEMVGSIDLSPRVVYLTGRQIGWAKEAIAGVGILRAEGMARMGLA
jgi:hypothetical protein